MCPYWVFFFKWNKDREGTFFRYGNIGGKGWEWKKEKKQKTWRKKFKFKYWPDFLTKAIYADVWRLPDSAKKTHDGDGLVYVSTKLDAQRGDDRDRDLCRDVHERENVGVRCSVNVDDYACSDVLDSCHARVDVTSVPSHHWNIIEAKDNLQFADYVPIRKITR